MVKVVVLEGFILYVICLFKLLLVFVVGIWLIVNLIGEFLIIVVNVIVED